MTAEFLAFSDFVGVKKRDALKLWQGRGETGPCKAPYHGKSSNGVPFIAPCRHCMPCRRRRQRNLIGMCAAEAELHPFSWVDTLTYETDPFPRKVPPKEWLKSEVQAYEKRLQRFYQCKFKVIIVSQLGTEKGRLHHHAIHFPQNPFAGEYITEQVRKDATRCWPHGHIMRDAFSPQAARYVVSYLTQAGKGTINLRKSSGIGWQYFQQWLDKPGARKHPILRGSPGCFNIGTDVYPIPRAWRDKAERLGYQFPEVHGAHYAEWIREKGPLNAELGHDADRKLKRQKEREKLAPRDPSGDTFHLHLLKKRKRSLQSPQELVKS